MTMNLRRRVQRAQEAAQAAVSTTMPWDILDVDPQARLAHVLWAMPAALHEAVIALHDDPRLPTIADLADRSHPALAAGEAELEAASDALDRGEPVGALPRPGDAIAQARQHLFGPHNLVPTSIGRTNRRTGYGMPAITYDLSTLEGSAEAVVDFRAYLMWNLGRDASQLWHDRHLVAAVKDLGLDA